MKKPTEKMIAYASDIYLYSPNDFTDEIRASFELTHKYIQENKRFLKRKKLFAPVLVKVLRQMPNIIEHKTKIYAVTSEDPAISELLKSPNDFDTIIQKPFQYQQIKNLLTEQP